MRQANLYTWPGKNPQRVVATLVLLMVVLVLGAPAPAQAWWDVKWHSRKKVTFDTTPAGADVRESLTEVPVLVRLHTGNFNFAGVKEDGSDIRFVSGDDKVLLKFHSELFDPVNEMALFWVRVPRLPGATNQDFFWIYYGNSAVSPAQDPGGTYDVPQVLVYHLAEASGAPQDQTAYGNHAAQAGGGNGLPAVIGNGFSLRSAEDRIVIPRSPSLNFSGGFSFSAWVRLAEPVKEARLLSWEAGEQSLVIAIDETEPYCRLTGGSGQISVTERTVAMTVETWHHLAVSVEPFKRVTLYLDGQESASAELVGGAIPEPSADLVLGASADTQQQPFRGDLDELQLQKVARSEGWFRLGFRGQGPDSSFLDVGEEEVGKGGEENLTIHLIRVVARTITLDGWVIIGILAIMSALSWIVFFYKGYVIHQCRRNDQMLVKAMQETPDPVLIFNEIDSLPNAPQYRLLEAGCEVLNGVAHRGGHTAQQGLPGVPINAVKTAMEKAAMKESRRLGAGLMILTMGISGGPFLGLLGTVWGVMNTFASMAEAGEANLTAIAPGVASALACTLAGLVVAIPALFCYGYLSARIKDLIADMHVFIDEFVLKLSATGEGVLK